MAERLLVVGATGHARALTCALSELGFYTSLVFGLAEATPRVIVDRPDIAVVEIVDPIEAVQVELIQHLTSLVLLVSPDVVLSTRVQRVDWPDDPGAVASVIASSRAAVTPHAPDGDSAERITQVAELRIDSRATQVFVNGRPAGLTIAEFRIVEALALGAGAVLARSELALVAGVGETRVIDALVSRARRKIAAAGARRSYIQTRVRHGYFFAPD